MVTMEQDEIDGLLVSRNQLSGISNCIQNMSEIFSANEKKRMLNEIVTMYVLTDYVIAKHIMMSEDEYNGMIKLMHYLIDDITEHFNCQCIP